MRRSEALQKANITHVVSALRQPLEVQLFSRFEHLVVELDDVDDEDIVQHFARSNAFIKEGLDSGGGVLVHWYVSFPGLCVASSLATVFVWYQEMHLTLCHQWKLGRLLLVSRLKNLGHRFPN